MRKWVYHFASLFGLSIVAAWGAATFFPSAFDIYKGFSILININPQPQTIKDLEDMDVSIVSSWIFLIAFCVSLLWGIIVTFIVFGFTKKLPSLKPDNQEIDNIKTKMTLLENRI